MHVSEDYDAWKNTYVDIHDLEQGIVYNLRVFGYSRGGEGLKSSPTVQFILGNLASFLLLLIVLMHLPCGVFFLFV